MFLTPNIITILSERLDLKLSTSIIKKLKGNQFNQSTICCPRVPLKNIIYFNFFVLKLLYFIIFSLKLVHRIPLKKRSALFKLWLGAKQALLLFLSVLQWPVVETCDYKNYNFCSLVSWWRHQMETFPALLAICEFTGYRWIPHTKASDVELWCFLWSAPASTVE